MRRLLAAGFLLALVSLCSARPALAQLGGLALGAAAGPVTPHGDAANAFKSGIHVEALAALSLPLVPIGFRGEVAYDQMDSKAGAAKLKVASGVFNATFSVPFPLIHPYAIGGVGYYIHNSSINATREGKIGVNGGAGVELKFAKLRAFAEARYHSISYSGIGLKLLPVTVGLAL
jgi:hypothetical protein